MESDFNLCWGCGLDYLDFYEEVDLMNVKIKDNVSGDYDAFICATCYEELPQVSPDTLEA